MKTIRWLVGVVMVVAGCATTEGAQVQASGEASSDGSQSQFTRADGTVVVCHKERELGTNIAETVCEPVEGTSLENRQAIDQMMMMKAQPGRQGN